MNRFNKIRLAVANVITPNEAWRPLPMIEPANKSGVHVVEVGSSGTEINAGYITEEYLSNIQGRDWAIKVDEIRRSDSNVSMVLKALKLPIKSANWYVETVGVDPDNVEQSQMALKQKRLIEKALFEDNGKSFTRLLGEILTFYDNGYSLFEITYKTNFGDEELGTYNTLKNIGFRSQKTINRWLVNEDGTLRAVTQNAYGDLGRNVTMDADFLMHFAPDMEGDNYEGLSILRPIYGNWMRKNAYLQWLAAGTEKSAIPTPTLQIPSGKVGDKAEKQAAERMIRQYTSNSSNYLMYPEGWVLDQFKMDFDPDKMLKLVQYEDQAMVNSILASFLLLGQAGNGGSLALGKDLSDFFGQTFQCTTDYISEVFQKRVIAMLIKMNFGNEKCLVGLKCESLKEDADAVFATTLKTFIDGKVITPDSPLEKFIREKYQYPEADPATARQQESQAQVAPQIEGEGSPFRFAEAKKKSTPELIRQTALDLREIFENQLSALGTDYIQALLKEKGDTSKDSQSKVPNATNLPNYKFYKDIVSFINIEAAADATMQLQNEGIKLSEQGKIRLSISSQNARRAKLEDLLKQITQLSSRYETNADYMRTKSELYKLRREFSAVYLEYKNEIPQWKSSKFRSQIESQVATLVDTQMNDLKKKIDLQYQSSLRSTDSAKQFEYDLIEAKDALSGSSAIASGADVISSQTINDTRLQVSLEDPDVESYTFMAVDDDRTTPICAELNGRTFSSNDPDLDRYSPPLHYNCRSYLRINMRDFKNNPEVASSAFAPSEAAIKSITLSEIKKCCTNH